MYKNNSNLNLILNTPKDAQVLFSQNDEIGFLLDIAHVDSLDNIQKFIDIKYPEILHIADRRMCVTHEHLPIGEGNINYQYI